MDDELFEDTENEDLLRQLLESPTSRDEFGVLVKLMFGRDEDDEEEEE